MAKLSQFRASAATLHEVIATNRQQFQFDLMCAQSRPRNVFSPESESAKKFVEVSKSVQGRVFIPCFADRQREQARSEAIISERMAAAAAAAKKPIGVR